MFRQIWQRILNLWRQIQRRFRKPAPPPPDPIPIRSFGEYEQKFMALLEGVAQGWSRGDIKGFLIVCKIKDAEWENWLQEFGERLLVSPETHLELGGRMVGLGEMNCGRISEVAGKIGRELLAGESWNRTLADGSLVVSEDIVTPLLEREGLSASSTDNSSDADEDDSTWKSKTKYIEIEISGADEDDSTWKSKTKYIEIKISGDELIRSEIEMSQEASELYEQGQEHLDTGNLEGAIAAYEKASEIEPQNYLSWNKLGDTLNDFGCYSEAIAAYKKALEIHPQNILSLHGLGITLYHLGHYSEAITSFKQVLKINPKIHFTWNGLGKILGEVGSYKEAIAAFDKALEFTDDQCWEAWFNRGSVFLKSGRYLEAIKNSDEGLEKYQPSNHDYRLACGTLHQHKGEAHYIQGKETATYLESFHKAKASYEQAREFLKSPLIPETYLEVMQGLITVCRSLGDAKTSEYLTEATTVLETLLLDNETHPEIKQRLQRKFVGLYQLEVDSLVESGDKVNALEKAEARKNFCLQWMRAASPNRTASPTYPEIRDLLTNNTETAIIYWHLSPVSLTAFIITPDKFEVIGTPVTDIFAKRNSQTLEKWLKNWKTHYQNYGKTTSKQQSKESHLWRESMTAQLQKLADILKIPEICTHLTNIQHLILIPHRDLHLLPLHFLFSDNLFTITYLPSIQVGIDRLDRKPSHSMSLLLVESPDPLLFAEIEAPAIANFHLNCNTISSSQATTDNLKEALQQAADIFHFTGHAYHNTKQPSQSALILKNKQPLTSEEIANFDLKSYYLVCLSACETGITGKEELIDEFVGLASSFLAAGAVYALSTLWIVDEISTALMMIRFYEILNEQRCQNKLHPALALKEAQKWLRTITYSQLSDWYLELAQVTYNSSCSQDLRDEANLIRRNDAKMDSDKPPYAALYHWAGFTITGKVNP
ncbi:CHAT domain-containing tetratricopeptide repeat protein [Microcoleus sp. B6-A1]|uniref:CHAT domain-containing tetratricopeptide repeat protein n=1 Tax=Microcoleus sp. B6-A1 TaxID=2818684 RepID=UPI002FD36519